jgi:hypothetical protein
MSRAYLMEWAQQLCGRYQIVGVLRDLATLSTSELAALIAFIEGHRALEAMAR